MAGRKNNHPYGLTIFSKKLNRQLSHSAPQAHPALPRIRPAHSLPSAAENCPNTSWRLPRRHHRPKEKQKKVELRRGDDGTTATSTRQCQAIKCAEKDCRDGMIAEDQTKEVRVYLYRPDFFQKLLETQGSLARRNRSRTHYCCIYKEINCSCHLVIYTLKNDLLDPV